MAEFARIVCFTAAVICNLIVVAFLTSWLCRSVKRSETELRARLRPDP